jgi:hypothetical protein
MKNKAHAVQSILEITENRAKPRQVPVHSPSAHTALQDPAMEEVILSARAAAIDESEGIDLPRIQVQIAAQFRPLPELQRETQIIANRHTCGSPKLDRVVFRTKAPDAEVLSRTRE